MLLEVKDIQVYYGAIHAIKGVSFEVNEGEIVTLIGANGAGKTTTLDTIAGLLRSRGGDIVFQGESISHKAPHLIVKDGLALVPEGRHIFPDLTVLENLKVGAYLRSDDISGDIQWVYDLFPRLRERSWQAGGTLSGLTRASGWVRNVSTAGIPPSRAAPFTAAAITPACPRCTPSNIPMAQCTGAARLFNPLNSR